MLGIEDKAVLAAYLLTIISALGCIIYGIINWSKGINIPGQSEGTVTGKDPASEKTND